MKEKTKEEQLKESIERIKFLTNYNFQPMGYGFEETPDDTEEIKQKMVLKESKEEQKKTLKEEFIELAKKHGLKNPETIYEQWNFEKKKDDSKDDDSDDDKDKKDDDKEKEDK